MESFDFEFLTEEIREAEKKVQKILYGCLNENGKADVNLYPYDIG